jgi:hypothetical protein
MFPLFDRVVQLHVAGVICWFLHLLVCGELQEVHAQLATSKFGLQALVPVKCWSSRLSTFFDSSTCSLRVLHLFLAGSWPAVTSGYALSWVVLGICGRSLFHTLAGTLCLCQVWVVALSTAWLALSCRKVFICSGDATSL